MKFQSVDHSETSFRPLLGITPAMFPCNQYQRNHLQSLTIGYDWCDSGTMIPLWIQSPQVSSECAAHRQTTCPMRRVERRGPPNPASVMCWKPETTNLFRMSRRRIRVVSGSDMSIVHHAPEMTWEIMRKIMSVDSAGSQQQNPKREWIFGSKSTSLPHTSSIIPANFLHDPLEFHLSHKSTSSKAH